MPDASSPSFSFLLSRFKVLLVKEEIKNTIQMLSKQQRIYVSKTFWKKGRPKQIPVFLDLFNPIFGCFLVRGVQKHLDVFDKNPTSDQQLPV
jgi:hypothetical protein